MQNTILEINNITKIFPHPEKPVIANDKVNFSLRKGEIHAIVGENGTGKSTLMNILYGLLQPDGGEILLNGEPYRVKNPREAIAKGIGMVHQHFMLVPSFTVAENLVFSYEPRKRAFFVDKAEAIEITKNISQKYGFKVDPTRKIQDSPLSMQQRVELLKILYQGAEVLIFDEPTAVLTPSEVDELISILHSLKRVGKSIIFISHKLREVMEIADRVTVMRKGRMVGTVFCSETSLEDLAEMMVGQRIRMGVRLARNADDYDTRPAVLKINGLSTDVSASGQSLKAVNLVLCKGQIVGIAGVGGNGQELLVETVTGLSRRITAGNIEYQGKDITKLDASGMRDIGIAHITGERYKRGISTESDIYDNLIMGAHRRAPWAGRLFRYPKKLMALTKELIEQFNIKVSSPQSNIMELSGGNIQKCILARELNLSKEFIVAEEPTRGVDVGSQMFIYEMLLEKVKNGYCVLLVSTDLDEVLALSNIIHVMFGGRIIGTVNPEEEGALQKIGLLMAGVTEQKEGAANDK